jgi:hypothetical protein
MVTPNGNSTLHFADGSSSKPHGLVIGADRTYSMLQPLLKPLNPFSSGIGGWNMICRNSEQTQSLITKLINRGSAFAYSDGVNLKSRTIFFLLSSILFLYIPRTSSAHLLSLDISIYYFLTYMLTSLNYTSYPPRGS